MAFIEAFASYLPEKVVTNAELAARLDCDPAWITRASGIEQRRYAADTESVVDLAVAAAQACLTRAARAPSDVQLLVVASASDPTRFPGPASLVAHRLGLEQTPALDVPVASAGGLIGMILGNALADTYSVVLVVAAEKMSSLALREPLDPNVAILFGDGAGACLLSSARGRARIADHVLHSDGAFAGSLAWRADGTFSMDGRSVLLQASRKFPRVIAELLERNALNASEVPVFLMHQANQNLMDATARALGVPAPRFFSNIRAYGNTSSASLFIAAADWQQSAGFQSGVPVVFAAFGAGFHWGAVLARGL
ncbi:MAG: ketoacyl-ACP synthase III [Acidobacteriia bacterium]|nr:ketoacyl-ACP synthase III [Terriglobia bacterium]